MLNIHKPNTQRVALVRQDGIGDFLLWVNTAQLYKSYFATSEIVFFGTGSVAELASIMPYWSTFVSITDEDYLEHSACREPFDLLVNLQYSRSALHEERIRRIPARERIAVSNQGHLSTSEWHAANTLYTRLLNLSPEVRHEAVRNFEIFKAISGISATPKIQDLRPYSLQPSTKIPSRYIAILPGASWSKKQFPWPRFVSLIKRVHNQFGIMSVLCGHSNDKTLCENITTNCPPQSVVDLSGELNLRELLYVIMGAQALIGNDSMSTHAANMLMTNSVCILGGGYSSFKPHEDKAEGRFFPYPVDLITNTRQITVTYQMPCYGCGYICIHNEVARDSIPCIDYISINSVLECIEQLLRTSSLN